MFWKKEKVSENIDNTFPYRYCNLFISDKFKEILFVPYGKVDNWAHVELDNIIVGNWPCKFEDLQDNIEKTLSRYLPSTTYEKGIWPSFDKSKAKTKKSFEVDYVIIRLETDTSRSYGDGEVERIVVKAHPTILDDFFLTQTKHLIDTKVAQMVIDIAEACFKIRS